jgi:hypothetical protein
MNPADGAIFGIGAYIGLVFSPLAALMVYLITLNEYQRHYPDKKMPRKIALQAAGFTVVAFILLGFVIGYLLRFVIE